jgi:hypothetical protein
VLGEFLQFWQNWWSYLQLRPLISARCPDGTSQGAKHHRLQLRHIYCTSFCAFGAHGYTTYDEYYIDHDYLDHGYYIIGYLDNTSRLCLRQHIGYNSDP